ncbi:MAG TPA: GAF domain-containing protein [Deltaproteobacteria bacterium]|nr:GAF domain-containing protein [Deltaproteobacteria bacterium]
MTNRNHMKKEGSGLRNTLLIVTALVFIIPFLIFTYIFYRHEIALDFIQMMMVAFILVLILAGLMILRQLFEKILTMVRLMKKVVAEDGEAVPAKRGVDEVQYLTETFEALMGKLENTTSDLGHKVFELLALKELIEIASKTLDFDELLSALLEKSMAVTSAQIGSIFKVAPNDKRFQVVATKGLRGGPEKYSFLNIDGSISQHVVDHHQPLLVKDIEADSRTQRPNDPKYGSPSFLSMPIFVKDELIAVLNLSRKGENGIFDLSDEQIISIMIGEIGFALENIRLYSKLREHLERLQERTVALEDANGRLSNEIDQRLSAEAALNNALEELKQTQAQLVQSAKLSSIGELAAGVAHELNQPLMVIRGHAQMLFKKRRPEDEDYDELEMILRNTKRLMKIISHLRIFSRQSGTEFIPLDLGTTIEDCFLMIEEQLRLGEIQVEKKVSEDLPKVWGDPNQLEQVLLNLITNAKDAIEQKAGREKKEISDESEPIKGKLTIEAHRDPDAHNLVELLVSDTGSGIPKEIADKIFDPFFTTKDVGKGTGLGLSISYGIIKDHKGEIAVSSTGPHGTTFRVKLPTSAESS